MKNKREPFCCIRCGYTTERKENMRKHFTKLKKDCPAIKNDLALTDEIKDHILKNRVYHIPSPIIQQQNIINQTINNYNTIHNYIASIPAIEKITKYIDYKQINLLDFEQTIEDNFSTKAKRLLESNCQKYSFSLDINDILQLIDKVSKITSDDDFEYMNIIYDNKHDRFNIYEEGDWKEWLKSIGLNKIIHYFKEYYLDSYEIYLIRRNKNQDIPIYNRSQSMQSLIEYYKFIGVFDIEPYIKGKSNNKVLYNPDQEQFNISYEPVEIEQFTLEDEFYPIYSKTRDNITKSEMNDIKKTILDVIKRNSNKTIEHLNKKVIELFNMDEQFQSIIINKLQA